MTNHDEDALAAADEVWAKSYGSGSRAELRAKHEMLMSGSSGSSSPHRSTRTLRAEVERAHVLTYGRANLAAELAEERERDAAAIDDGALVPMCASGSCAWQSASDRTRTVGTYLSSRTMKYAPS